MPAQIPRLTPPARNYVTRIASLSGHIGGSYFLGSVRSFKSTSGDNKAKVLPVIQYLPSTDPDDAPKIQFETKTVSGKHELDVLKPFFFSLLLSNKPDQHQSPAPYIPIGDGGPYRDILLPDLNRGIVLEEQSIGAERRVVKN
jgi:hypothetical protein